MKIKRCGWLLQRQIGGCLVLLLAAPTIKAAAMPQQEQASIRQEQGAPAGSQPLGAEGVSGKPADSAPPNAALPDAPEVAQAQNPNPQGDAPGPQPSRDQQQNGLPQPVGTAAAPSVTRTGVMASKPAGAAIAPAKQRRVRVFLISLAVVAATGVAIGTVAGLSHTSPSQPK